MIRGHATRTKSEAFLTRPVSRREGLALGALLGFALLLYLCGITYGLPSAGRAWDHDEIQPWQVVGAMQQGLKDGAWPAKYPPFQYYLLWLPCRLALAWLGPQATLLADSRSRDTIFLVTRALSLVMGTLSVLFLWLAARRALDPLGAWLAAAVAAVALPAVFYAKAGNLDTPYTFWFTVFLWFFFRAMDEQRLRDYLGVGLSAAASVATKDQAYGLLLAAPLPLLLALSRHRRQEGQRPGLLRLVLDRRLVIGGLAAAALFAVAHQLPTQPEIFIDHYRRITGPYPRAFRVFEPNLSGQIGNLALAWRNTRVCLGWPLFATALLGIPWVLRRRDRPARRLGAALLLAIVYYLSFIAVILWSYERFFLPVAQILALFAGALLADLARSRRLPRGLGPLLAGGLLLHGVTRAMVLDLLMVRDSRYAVESWIAERLGPGETALALGDPVRGPRLRTLSWASVAPRIDQVLESWQPRFLVLNLTDLRASQRAGRKSYPELLAGARGYELKLLYRYAPPLLRLDLEGSSGSLYFINPELAVLERRSPAGGPVAPLAPGLAGEIHARGRAALADGRAADAWRLLDLAERRAAEQGDDLTLLAIGREYLERGMPVRAGRAAASLARLAPRTDLGPRAVPIGLWRAAWLLRAAGRTELARDLLERAESFDRRGATGLDLGPFAIEPPLDGTWPPEATAAGERFRWTTACASARVERFDPGAVATIRYRCGPEAGRQAFLRAGSAPPLPLTCGDERIQSQDLALPAGLWGSSPELPLEVVVEPPFVPALLWGGDDPRELGLQVLSLTVAPALAD